MPGQKNSTNRGISARKSKFSRRLALQKHKDSSDWCLNRQIFLKIQKLIGELEIDLFASTLNYQLKKFGSWNPDPMSLATDAFLLNWTTIKGYTFPPFSLIGRCLAKVKKEKSTITLFGKLSLGIRLCYRY